MLLLLLLLTQWSVTELLIRDICSVGMWLIVVGTASKEEVECRLCR
jgi:hypothetical protein